MKIGLKKTKTFYCDILSTRFPKVAGFSLTEIVVTIAITGILFGMAVPSWNQAKNHQKLIQTVEQIELDLYELFSRARNLNDQTARFVVFNKEDTSYSFGGETRQLPSGIFFDSEHTFTFKPPYGDVSLGNTSAQVWLQNSTHRTGLQLYPKSGLIERLPTQNIQTVLEAETLVPTQSAVESAPSGLPNQAEL